MIKDNDVIEKSEVVPRQKDISVDQGQKILLDKIRENVAVLENSGSYGPHAVSDERKVQILSEIGQAASFFNEWGSKWYLVGGLALELASRDIYREHTNDIDVAIKEKDVQSLVTFAISRGWKVVKPLSEAQFDSLKIKLGENPKIEYDDKTSGSRFVETRDLEVILSGGNFFLTPTEFKPGSVKPYDIDVIHENEDGCIIFPPDKNISFPAELYEQAPVYSLPNGEVVHLTPPIVQLLYKLFAGRDKELVDVLGGYSRLNEHDTKLLNSYLSHSGTKFKTGSKETTNVTELLASISSQELEDAAKGLGTKPGEKLIQGKKHWEVIGRE